MRLAILVMVLMTIGCKSSFKRTEHVPGPQGEQGIPGVNGTNGVDGLSGEDGQQGLSGANGIDGQDGSNGLNGTNGSQGIQGPKGENGEDAKESIETQVYLVPTRGKCVQLAPGIYAENEGDHADIYNNSSCSHNGGNNKAICNDLSDGEDGTNKNEVCEVIYTNEVYQFTIQGQFEDLCIIKRHSKGLEAPVTL